MGTVCAIPTRHWKISPLEDITSWGPYLDRGDGFETFFCFFFWCFTRCSIYSFFERVFNIFINIDLLALFSSSLSPPCSNISKSVSLLKTFRQPIIDASIVGVLKNAVISKYHKIHLHFHYLFNFFTSCFTNSIPISNLSAPSIHGHRR